MDVSGYTIGLDIFVSVLFGTGGAIGVWFKLKGKVNIQDVKIENLEAERRNLHNRIDGLKSIVEKNREKQDSATQEIKSSMNAMELRIIKAIHEIGKK